MRKIRHGHYTLAAPKDVCSKVDITQEEPCEVSLFLMDEWKDAHSHADPHERKQMRRRTLDPHGWSQQPVCFLHKVDTSAWKTEPNTQVHFYVTDVLPFRERDLPYLRKMNILYTFVFVIKHTTSSWHQMHFFQRLNKPFGQMKQRISMSCNQRHV